MSKNINVQYSVKSIIILIIGLVWFSPQLSSQQLASKGEVAAGKQGMIAVAHPLAAKAAIEILKQGGNAVDAAVAAAFAIGVVEPDGSGLGGGGGMVIWLQKQKKAIFINYYTKGSENIGQVNFVRETDQKTPKAVLVPGTVAGLTLALEKYGTLPLSKVIGPAIEYARTGFPVDETLGKLIFDNASLLQKYESTSQIYMNEGFPIFESDTLRQPDLANTLSLIAEKGRAGFYEGEVAEKMSEAVNSEGGALTLTDLKNYQAEIMEPLHGTYRGYDVYTCAGNLAGVSILEGLNVLENANLKQMGKPASSTETAHFMVEAVRRVSADRNAFHEDPNFGEPPITGLISKDFAMTRFNDINMNYADPKEYRKTKAGNPERFNNNGLSKSTGIKKKISTEDDSVSDDEEEGSAKWGDELFGKYGLKKKKKASTPKKGTTNNTEKAKSDNDENEDSNKGTTTEGQQDVEFDGHTTHLSVIDKDGNAVSLTQTLGTFFGSGLVVNGVLLNNAGSNFSTTTSINQPEPGKRPRSSISCTILTKNDKPAYVIGSPGGGRIIPTVIQIITDVVDFGMDAGEAVKAPRFFCQKSDDYLHIENRFEKSVQDGLREKGHNVKLYGDYDLFFGGVHMIAIDPATGVYYGSADPRRGGAALGY